MIATPLRSPLTCLPPLLVPCSLRPSPLYMFASSPLNTCCVSSLLTTLLRLLSPNTFGTPPLPLSSSLYLLSPGIFFLQLLLPGMFILPHSFVMPSMKCLPVGLPLVFLLPSSLFCLKVCVLVFFCRLSTVPFPPSHFIFLILVAHILRLADYFDCIDYIRYID